MFMGSLMYLNTIILIQYPYSNGYFICDCVGIQHLEKARLNISLSAKLLLQSPRRYIIYAGSEGRRRGGRRLEKGDGVF